MKNSADKKIFISYRVQDTAGETGRLVDVLKQYFTDDQLFMDIENLEPGVDFTEGIEKSLTDCDVFLAVIGPNWAGERPTGPSRLNDPGDWVRTEVGTALRRNIRVVPVLVDGGNLPKSEDLPPELQPLLKRQTLEISNKRWRYDTDQLVSFLVKTVGIPPKRAALNRATPAPKKNRTWLYVGAGFVLAILMLAIIGLQMEDENKSAVQTQSDAASQSNPAPGSGTPRQTVLDNGEADAQASAAGSVNGTWDEMDETDPSTFVLTQNGIHVEAQVQVNGQLVATGSGSLQNGTLELNVPVMGVATVLRASLSADGTTLSGNYTVPATGESHQVRLVRRNP